jgi:pimeloyl-ACP methyl ester carboxylesterase
MITTPELWLPEDYNPLYTPLDAEIHEVLATRSLANFLTSKPEMRHVDLADGTQMGYYDLPAIQEEDAEGSATATVELFSFANGYGPGLHVLTEIKRAFLPRDRRTLVFPNNAYEFTDPQKAYPIPALAGKVVETLVKVGVEDVTYDGYSQGALVAAAALNKSRSNLEVLGAVLGDPPIKADRSAEQIKKDFMGDNPIASIKALFKAVNDSGIPALTDAQNARWRRLPQWLRGGMAYQKAAKSEPNYLLHQAMAGDPLTAHIEAGKDVVPARNLVIVRMAAGLICSSELDERMAEQGLATSVHLIKEYGHEGGDNAVLRALLLRQAIMGTDAK